MYQHQNPHTCQRYHYFFFVSPIAMPVPTATCAKRSAGYSKPASPDFLAAGSFSGLLYHCFDRYQQ